MLKWPKNLYIEGTFKADTTWNVKSFYSLNVPYGSAYKKFLLMMVVLGIIGFCMMPVWPDEWKSIILTFNIGLLYFLFGILFLRIILYMLSRIFMGKNFWLFPNYLEDVGFFESFQPFFSVEDSEEGLEGIISRLIGFALTLFIAYTLY